MFRELQRAHQCRVPRWIRIVSNSVVELHGFSDASTKAMAATIYVRILRPDHVNVSLLLAKTKLAPVNKVTIPRLELCAALLVSKLAHRVHSLPQFQRCDVHLWSDSTFASAWIGSSPHLWQPYISHRVAEIAKLTAGAHWHHITGSQNPANLATRGLTYDELVDAQLWWRGPDLLRDERSPFPNRDSAISIEQCPKRRRTAQAVCRADADEWNLLLRFLSLFRLIRITAWIRRFCHNLQLKKDRSPLFLAKWLQPFEIANAQTFWIQHAQKIHFSTDYMALQAGRDISTFSPLIKLTPFFDRQLECLRLGGRLRHADLPHDAKHSLILPERSTFSRMVTIHVHLTALHYGLQLTMSILREKYWIISARKVAKFCIRNCVVCTRHRAVPLTQQMGDSAVSRVRSSDAFCHVGVDYAGPIQIRTTPGRGQRSQKGNVAVFVCFSSKAVHLEAVSSLDTRHFLEAFTRFISRRGLPTDVYSDCGTNFVGASREIRDAFTSRSPGAEISTSFAANRGIRWHFNPPATPHFGGLWEAAVKSMKRHLIRQTGNQSYTFEEISTILATIEACLNSRPLTPIFDSPDELAVLTPAHLIGGRSLLALPAESTSDEIPGHLERWQLANHLRERFWSQWKEDYLHCLQTRQKWHSMQANLNVGSLVLAKAETTPPL